MSEFESESGNLTAEIGKIVAVAPTCPFDEAMYFEPFEEASDLT